MKEEYQFTLTKIDLDNLSAIFDIAVKASGLQGGVATVCIDLMRRMKIQQAAQEKPEPKTIESTYPITDKKDGSSKRK